MNRSFVKGLLTGTFLSGLAVSFLLLSGLLTSPPPVHSLACGAGDVVSFLPDSFQAAQQAGLMGNLLDRIDASRAEHPDSPLFREIIERIAVFCAGARPYLGVLTEGQDTNYFSPERGQLLLILSRLSLDAQSWQQIRQHTTFAAAYLPSADLTGVDLRKIDLRGAMLREASLDRANLAGANLAGADLWGAGLHQAGMDTICLNRANLSWSDLTGARLSGADLGSATLISARMDGADLRGALMGWANAQSATIRRAKLIRANLSGCLLQHALLDSTCLDSATLTHARMIDVSLRRASLRGAELHLTAVPDEHWLEALIREEVAGVEGLQDTYDFIDERSKGRQFILKKKPK